MLSTGCQWQALPKDLPPKSTAHYYFMLWDWDGTLERIHHALYVATREQRGARGEPDGGDHRQPERQGRSKRGSALDPQGFDAGKKVTGRKRHILVDTLGLLLNVVVHPADVQDRDGARLVLDRRTRRLSSRTMTLAAVSTRRKKQVGRPASELFISMSSLKKEMLPTGSKRAIPPTIFANGRKQQLSGRRRMLKQQRLR